MLALAPAAVDHAALLDGIDELVCVTDALGRLGGDEFVVLAAGAAGGGTLLPALLKEADAQLYAAKAAREGARAV